MGYFALFRTATGQSFEVLQCHINVWVLAGFPSHQFFLDVGLYLEAPAGHALPAFELAVPFQTNGADALRDLTAELTNQTTAELIFGTSVAIDTNTRTLNYLKGGQGHERRLEAVVTLPTKDASEPVERASDFTLWSIKLTTPIPAGEKRYLRFRFRIAGLGRTWQWGNYDALFNFRVSDIREAAGVTKLNDRKDRILDIKRLHLFLVAPSHLEPVVIEPELQYARLFEGENWESYLRRKVRFVFWWWRKPKLAIYQWTNALTETGANPPANPPAVSRDAPFRAYAQLRCWPARLPNRWVMLAFLVFLVVFHEDILGVVQHIREWIKSQIGGWWQGLLALGAVAVAKWALGAISKLPKVADVVQNAVRFVDRWLYWDTQ